MKKFTKLFISLFAAVALATPVLFSACEKKPQEKPDEGNNNNTQIEAVDYAGQVKLDLTSNTKKQEVTVRQYIDGDTTHFNPVKNSNLTGYNAADFAETDYYIKARYLAVNTPESTGKIEPWGKKASKFTQGKLEGAQSIIVESDDDKWNIDSTGERYTLWIWYQPKGETEYRNLNLEILQEGLALGSNAAGNRYGTVATNILNQARALELYVFSKAKDPDFPYGSAIPVTLKELRCHIADYDNKRVRVEGVVAAEFNNSVYIEAYDEETDAYFGMSVYYGFKSGQILTNLSIGNLVSVSGVVTYYQAGDSYQISDVNYDPFAAADKNTTVVSSGHEPAFAEVDAADIVSGQCTVRFVKETEDEDGKIQTEVEDIKLDYGEAVMSTSVMLKNLKVTEVYTTKSGKSAGAMSITCEYAPGKTIVVRTEVLKDADGNLITADQFPVGSYINAKGIVEKYEGQYQVKCYRAAHLEVVG